MIDTSQKDMCLKHLKVNDNDEMLRKAQWEGLKDALRLSGEPLSFDNIFMKMRETAAENERMQNEMNNSSAARVILEDNQYE